MDRFVARTSDTVVEDLDDGLVIYDERTARAHWLDANAAAVWRACHQPSTAEEILAEGALDATQGEAALAQLIDLGLVETGSGAGYSRRAVLLTAAKVGVGGAVAAPIISAVIPVAAAHASTTGGGPPPPTPAISDATPGYWKNSKHQTPGLLPVSLGAYSVTSWSDAEDILSQSCAKNNRLNCLAHHLLSAELFAIGGGPNPACLSSVISNATALMHKYNYSGTSGSYTLSKADDATVTSLLGQFANYEGSGGTSC